MMNSKRVPADEVLGYANILLQSGKVQVCILFDWRTGEYVVSWPSFGQPTIEEEEDEDE